MIASPDYKRAVERAAATLRNTLDDRGYKRGTDTSLWAPVVRREVSTLADLERVLAVVAGVCDQPARCAVWADTTHISIHQGHGIYQPVAPEPDWTGTVAEYLDANPDVTWAEVQDMRADLDGTGRHRIGGGARGCFTIVLAPEDR